jgi:hypothetical protein
MYYMEAILGGNTLFTGGQIGTLESGFASEGVTRLQTTTL